MADALVPVNGIFRKVTAIDEVANGIIRRVPKIPVPVSGTVRKGYVAYKPPVKIASGIQSGAIDISAYNQKTTDNFIVDVGSDWVDTSYNIRGARILFSKTIAGNTLNIQALVEGYLSGQEYAAQSLTFDVWYVDSPQYYNRLLGTSPIDISDLSSDVNLYACEPVTATGAQETAAEGSLRGQSYKTINGTTLTAYVTAYTDNYTVVTSNSKVYYLGDIS